MKFALEIHGGRDSAPVNNIYPAPDMKLLLMKVVALGQTLCCSRITLENIQDVSIGTMRNSAFQNSGVILAATSVHWIMAPAKELKRILGPILFTLCSSPDATYPAQELKTGSLS